MRIVVTGALGHIGSRLIRELPAAFPAAEIVLIDNLSTQRYCSLFSLSPAGRYAFREADVLTHDLVSLFSGAHAVIHLAAITDAAGSFGRKEDVERVNLVGTERVAQACSETGSALIFLSTTSVYGSQTEVVDENCSLSDLRPQSPYAESKLKAEQMLQTLGGTGRLRFVICRFGTIFGVSPGMRFHTAVNKFVWQACVGQPLTVWRTAMDQKRPYLDLGDAVQALMFIMDGDRYDGQVYNVLTTNATVRDIVQIIQTQVPDTKVTYVDEPIMNQLSYDVSCERFKALGFQFKGSLVEGISTTIDMLRNVRVRSDTLSPSPFEHEKK